jgi:hypothetical protein
MAIDDEGRMILRHVLLTEGWTKIPTPAGVTVEARFLKSGDLDTSYGENGVLVTLPHTHEVVRASEYLRIAPVRPFPHDQTVVPLQQSFSPQPTSTFELSGQPTMNVQGLIAVPQNAEQPTPNAGTRTDDNESAKHGVENFLPPEKDAGDAGTILSFWSDLDTEPMSGLTDFFG